MAVLLPSRALAALGVLAGLGAALLPTEARAEDSPVKGLRIVVPDARGKTADNRAALTKAVRRALSEGVGPLIASQKLEAAQKKLKLKKDELTSPAGLAQAARAIDAQYVLSIEVTKEKWTYTAHAQLINSENAEVQMDFRSQYFKPAAEAEDRGKRIGARTLLKLEELLKQGPAPFAGGNPALASEGDKGGNGKRLASEGDKGGNGKRLASEGDKGGNGKRLASEGDKGGNGGRLAAEGDKGGNGGRLASEGDKGGNGASSSYAGGSSVGGSGGSSSSASASSGGSASSWSGGSTSAGTTVTPRRTTVGEPGELFRASFVGGAGILHTYDLSASAVPSSRLSYKLDPLAMLNGELEVVVPGLPLGVLARASYRPVHFKVTVQDAPAGDDANNPKGMFLDTAALLRWHLALSGEGLYAYQLIPAAGVRLGLVNVERHPADPILGSTSFAPIVGLAVRLPINEVLELNAGVDGGLILGYSETPATTGAKKDSGFTFGGDVAARIWLSSAVAIAFDMRFDYEKVTFTGTPTRIQAPNEALVDAASTTKDLRTGIGVAFRL